VTVNTILAAGLSPAWQKILEFEQLLPGEVNRAAAASACASGKVLNVGRACHRLGAATRTLTVVGGATGRAIQAEFATEGLSARWVEVARPTRTCITLLEAGGRVTELVENAAPLDPWEAAQFAAAFAEEATAADVAVLSGSLPPGVPTTFYARLLRDCPAAVVLDAQGPELLAALPHRPLVVKPNRSELERTLGRAIHTDGELNEAMGELHRLGAEWVVVSQGAGPVWVSHGNRRWRWAPLEVSRPRNPIGCGDCLGAGIAVALARGAEVPAAVPYGLAAAAENLEGLLPARLDPQRVAARCSAPGDRAASESS
jgi:1-phosphofructokinase family hexose kinase